MEDSSRRNYPPENQNVFKEFFLKIYSALIMFISTLFMANPNNRNNNNSNTGRPNWSNNIGNRANSQPTENTYANSFRRFGGMGGG